MPSASPLGAPGRFCNQAVNAACRSSSVAFGQALRFFWRTMASASANSPTAAAKRDRGVSGGVIRGNLPAAAESRASPSRGRAWRSGESPRRVCGRRRCRPPRDVHHPVARERPQRDVGDRPHRPHVERDKRGARHGSPCPDSPPPHIDERRFAQQPGCIGNGAWSCVPTRRHGRDHRLRPERARTVGASGERATRQNRPGSDLPCAPSKPSSSLPRRRRAPRSRAGERFALDLLTLAGQVGGPSFPPAPCAGSSWKRQSKC